MNQKTPFILAVSSEAGNDISLFVVTRYAHKAYFPFWGSRTPLIKSGFLISLSPSSVFRKSFLITVVTFFPQIALLLTYIHTDTFFPFVFAFFRICSVQIKIDEYKTLYSLYYISFLSQRKQMINGSLVVVLWFLIKRA